MKKEKTPLYTFARVVIGIGFRVAFGVRATGMENYPQDQNCIILSNHISALDPLTIAMFYKVSEIHFIGKESLFRNKFLAKLLTTLHAFPVNRGETDMGAMRTAMQIVRDGYVLGIFPEGHRQQGEHMQRIETGVAVMALKTDVPVVPVCITGKYRPFGKLRVTVGEPIPMDDLRAMRSNSEVLETLKQRIIDSVEALRKA